MLQRLRRVQGQEGFTLIELLVVILIIGILAAVAIPSFLAQKGKAQDANVKTDITTAQTAEETYNTNSAAGGYVGAAYGGTGATAPANLTTLESTLTPAFNSTEQLSVVVPGSAQYGATDPTGGSAAVVYDITAISNSGVQYALTKYADGGVSRTCKVTASQNPSGCSLPAGTNSGNGTWGS